MELKQKLSDLRKRKGLTQLELAEILSVSRQAVSRWEVGTAVPSLDNLANLSKLYGVPMDYLVHDELECPEEPKPKPAGSVGGRLRRIAPIRSLVLILCTLMAGILIAVASLKLYRSHQLRKMLESTVILNIGGVRGKGYIISENPEKFQDGEISLPLAPYDPDKPDFYIQNPDGTYKDVPSLLEPLEPRD